MSDSERMARLRKLFPKEGFFQDKEWVLSPRAFPLSEGTLAWVRDLGPTLRRFQEACEELYVEAAGNPGGKRGWVARLLDAGKPESVVELARETSWRGHLPRVIRPDLMLTEEGVSIAELDSLPGGMGLTAWLNESYAELGEDVIGGAEGMIEGFRAAFPDEDLVVSRESADYEPEMRWLAARLQDGRQVLNPWSMDLEGLKGRSIYRFFELFDLANVERSGEVVALATAGDLEVTPPLRAFLEEKLWLALFWVPSLRGFWEGALESAEVELLRRCVPQGWVMDPAALPAFAEIAGLGVADWEAVAALGRKQRELVVKVSGFSELGWGSRGVSIGHDLSQREWGDVVKTALAAHGTQPHLMQRFHAAKVVEHPAWDEAAGVSRWMASRARLCPYYFVPKAGGAPRLGGVLATVCPADKKLLHGMRDAMMLPCCRGMSEG